MNKYLKLSSYLNYLKLKVSSFRYYQKSYSQVGEDLILSFLLKNKKNGFYIDVGANDPKKFNNTYFFYKKGWRGINIEPNKKKIKFFNFWRKRDLNLNFGVGTNKEEMTFYNFKEDTLSTFSKSVADDYVGMGHKILNVEKVQILSLKEIFDKFLGGVKIDFLSVDTEGNDIDVLKSNDWLKYRPEFLIVETLEYKRDNSAKKLNVSYDDYLESINYEKIAETYINTIYRDIK